MIVGKISGRFPIEKGLEKMIILWAPETIAARALRKIRELFVGRFRTCAGPRWVRFPALWMHYAKFEDLQLKIISNIVQVEARN